MFQDLEPLAAVVTGESTAVNGNPALIPCLTGELDGVLAVRVEKARISGFCDVRNPEKPTRVESGTPLTRR